MYIPWTPRRTQADPRRRETTYLAQDPCQFPWVPWGRFFCLSLSNAEFPYFRQQYITCRKSAGTPGCQYITLPDRRLFLPEYDPAESRSQNPPIHRHKSYPIVSVEEIHPIGMGYVGKTSMRGSSHIQWILLLDPMTKANAVAVHRANVRAAAVVPLLMTVDPPVSAFNSTTSKATVIVPDVAPTNSTV